GLMELNRSKEELRSIKSLIEKGEEGLLEIEKKINSLGEDLSPEMKAVFESIQERVEDGLDELPVDKEAIRQDINNGIKTIDEKTKELNSHKSQLKEQKSELLSKESEISKGKNLLTSEMSKARFELMDGEKKLDEKMGEFEEAKEEAFKKASLDGALTRDMISNILKAQNFSMPMGYINEGGSDYLVKIGDEIQDEKEMENLLLFDTGEEAIGKIYLSDVADVSLTDNADETYAKVNGNNAVILNFQKQSNFSTSEVSKSINE